MDHSCSTHKKSWFLPVVVILGILAFVGFRYFNVFAVYPLLMLVLCPLIHGGMFYFMGKGMAQKNNQNQSTGEHS